MNKLFERINVLKERTKSLNGLMLARDEKGQLIPEGNGFKKIAIGESLNATFDRMVKDWDPVKARDLMERKLQGDKDAARSLNGIRVDQVNNFIWPSLNFASRFFDVVDLAKDERPVVQNTTKYQIKVGYMGTDGKPSSVKLVNETAETLIPLVMLASEKYGYRLMDIYNGDIADVALKTVDVAFDLANQIDQLAYNLLTASTASGGALGSFTNGRTNRSQNVFVAHTRINTTNLPSTNDLTKAGITGSTTFGIEDIRSVMQYCGQWANAFREGPLVPTGEILIPSIDYVSIANQLTPTGSTNNPTANQMMNQYASFDYLGTRWQLIPDTTIASGKAYFPLNRKVGTIYAKSSMDAAFEDVDDQQNYAERWQRKVFGIYIAEPQRVNALRLTYHT